MGTSHLRSTQAGRETEQLGQGEHEQRGLNPNDPFSPSGVEGLDGLGLNGNNPLGRSGNPEVPFSPSGEGRSHYFPGAAGAGVAAGACAGATGAGTT